MVGKRVEFDDETWEAIQAVMRDSGSNFKELADEAFADLLKKHKQPIGLKAALKESVAGRPHRKPRGKGVAYQPSGGVRGASASPPFAIYVG